MEQNKYPNDLIVYRGKRELNRKQVCTILGLKHPGTLSRYERGEMLPSLVIALKLETLYRTPIAFLYAPLYQRIKDAVRAEEERSRSQTTGDEVSASETPA